MSGSNPRWKQYSRNVRNFSYRQRDTCIQQIRDSAREAEEKYGNQDPWFGLEQEYTMIDPSTGWPAGFPANGFPALRGRITVA